MIEEFQIYRLLGQNIYIWPKSNQPTLNEVLTSYNKISTESIEQNQNKLRLQESLASRLMSYGLIMQIPHRSPHGQPLWKDHWTGSMSHKLGHSALWLGYASEFGFGIDLELAENLKVGVINKIMTTEEQNLAGSALGETSSSLVFSMKEAIYKALFPMVQKVFYFECAYLIDACRVYDEVSCIFRMTRDLSENVLKDELIKVSGKLITVDHRYFWLTLAQTNFHSLNPKITHLGG